VQSILTRFLMIFSLLVISSTSAFSQGETPKDAYQSAWSEVSELLRKRKYASAIAKLDSLTEERDLRDDDKQIEADKKAIDGLLVLERIVLEQAAKLEAGTSIEVSGIGYTVVRYEKSPKGDALVLKSNSLGREARKLVADLPSGTWVELAEADLAPLDNAPLTLGIFLAFDRIADRKAARKLLNEAASHGHDVTPWLARLEAEEAGKKDRPKGEDDPFIGKWSIAVGPWPATVEIRKNGVGMLSFDPRTIAAMKAKSGEDRSAFQTNMITWERKKDGTYCFTIKGGATFDGISVDGDRALLPGAKPWVRQADR